MGYLEEVWRGLRIADGCCGCCAARYYESAGIPSVCRSGFSRDCGATPGHVIAAEAAPANRAAMPIPVASTCCALLDAPRCVGHPFRRTGFGFHLLGARHGLPRPKPLLRAAIDRQRHDHGASLDPITHFAGAVVAAIAELRLVTLSRLKRLLQRHPRCLHATFLQPKQRLRIAKSCR